MLFTMDAIAHNLFTSEPLFHSRHSLVFLLLAALKETSIPLSTIFHYNFCAMSSQCLRYLHESYFGGRREVPPGATGRSSLTLFVICKSMTQQYMFTSMA